MNSADLRQRLADTAGTRMPPSRHDSFHSDRKSSDATVCARPATSPGNTTWSVDPPAMPIPTKENDWLGFCPSAVKLQAGDKKGSLKKRTDYSASFAAAGLTTFYCSAKGCSFQGHISVDFVWKTVMKDDRLGLKCRWAFLAKSHIKQSSVTAKQYQFQCPICIFSQGHAEGRVWKGVEIFMEHVSTHRGKDLAPEVLQKLNIVNDRTVDEKEDFDMNLIPTQSQQRKSHDRESVSGASITPPTLSRAPTRTSIADSIWSRKGSSVLDLGSGLTRSWTSRTERADSVLAGAVEEEEEEQPTPLSAWSDGLSYFKVDREEDYLSPDF